MRCGQYRFSCTFRDEALLPEYKGSTFRGVFGHALKRVVCALRRRDCADCLLRDRCLYVFVFETPAPGSPHDEPKPSPFRPYVLSPVPDDRTRYHPGDTFAFDLLLFGKANDDLPYFIYAFDQVGQGGIGRKIDGHQARFTLTSVSAGEQSIFSARDGKVSAGDWTTDLKSDLLTALSAAPEERQSLEIRLLTPLRLKYENRLEAGLPFHILVRAALRRISMLCNAFGDGEPDLDYRGLVSRARPVRTLAPDLRWFDWQRYSNRQDQAMLMGGLVGLVNYAGDLGPFLPLLRFCERTHLGKQTTFGLGKIRIGEANP